MSIQAPNIIFETDRPISPEAAARIKKAWQAYCENIWLGKPAALVLEDGLRARPFPVAPAIPDAFCRFCGVANLSTSVWCQGCGAPMIREATHA